MTSLSFFWVARNRDGGDDEYVVSAYPMEKHAWTGADGTPYVEWETGRGDDVQLCVPFWHLAGGPILAPGAEPQKARITLQVQFVS